MPLNRPVVVSSAPDSPAERPTSSVLEAAPPVLPPVLPPVPAAVPAAAPIRRFNARKSGRPDPRDPLRLGFTSAAERLREAVWHMMRIDARRLPDRHRQMLAAIARATVPKRPERRNPREVKIKMSKYRLKSYAA